MRKFLRFVLWTALILGALLGVLRATAIRWFRIAENDPYLEASIAPTLRGGDMVVAWRLTKPAFGDLVICPEPKAPDRIVIGRIVGEAGDTVRVDEATIYINGSPAPTERACTQRRFTVTDPNNQQPVEMTCNTEVIGGRSHMRGMGKSRSIKPLPQTYTVEAGRVYLVSDNRLFPYDSREFGTVDRSTCKEFMLFRLWSRAGYSDEDNRFSFIQ